MYPLRAYVIYNNGETPDGVRSLPLSSDLQFDNSALKRDHGGMSAVVRIQLHQDMLNSAFHRFFSDRKLSRATEADIVFCPACKVRMVAKSSLCSRFFSR